jgi:CheY-like chemotaxis protein
MPRVLLVEDDATYRRALRSILVQDGIQVVGEAEDGAAGLKLAGELHPDVVLMDLRMPGMGGLEATRSIRQRLPNTQIIIVTSYEGPLPTRSAEQAGAYAYLVKGCSGRLVREVVQQAWKLKQGLDQVAFGEAAAVAGGNADLFWGADRGAFQVGAAHEPAGDTVDAAEIPMEMPDSVPDDFVERYGAEARQAVRYRASRRYRMAKDARVRFSLLGDREVWTTAVIVFGFALFAMAFVGALVYMVMLWPWTGLFFVAPILVLLPLSLWTSTRIVKRDRASRPPESRTNGF